MTTIKRNEGGDIAINVAFYGPPSQGGNLGPEFDITGWTVLIYRPTAQLLGRETVTVTNAATGKVQIVFRSEGSFGAGTEAFSLRLQRAAWIIIPFPRTQIIIGNFNAADFDGEPPYQQLSGPGGVQATIAPAEPEIIYGDAPAITIDSNAITIDSNAITIDQEAA
jgi:hypothetical protein